MRHSSTRHKLLFVAAVAALVTTTTFALAYVRSTTEKGTAVAWPSGCTWIAADLAGSQDLPLDVVVATLGKSIAGWQSMTIDAGCSYLRINQDPAVAAEAHLDQKNYLKFRRDKWCRPAETNNPETCYSSSAAAITTVFYTSNPGKPDDGQILDADIQMNEIHFTFVVITPENTRPTARQGTQIADLENTLTHELGHFQGLDHTCWDMAPPHQTSAPVGSDSLPVPSCTDVGNRMVPLRDYLRITEASMFNVASPGEIIKRSPSADDIAGVCGIYPAAKNPNVCERPQDRKSGGCTVSSPGGAAAPASASLLIVLGALGLLLRRARHRPPKPPRPRARATRPACSRSRTP